MAKANEGRWFVSKFEETHRMLPVAWRWLAEAAKTEGRVTHLGNVGSGGSLRFTFGDFVNGDDSAERGFGK